MSVPILFSLLSSSSIAMVRVGLFITISQQEGGDLTGLMVDS